MYDSRRFSRAFVSLVVAATGFNSLAAGTVRASAPGVCDLETNNDPLLQWEVASQADLEILDDDAADCSNLTIYQTGDIDLDNWSDPVSSWYGTFNGNRHRFYDSNEADREASLFDMPDGSLVLRNVHRVGDVRGAPGAPGTPGASGSDDFPGIDGMSGGEGATAGGLVGATGLSVRIIDSSFVGDVDGGAGGPGGSGGRGGGADPLETNPDGGDGGDGGAGGAAGGLVGAAGHELTITNSFAIGTFTAGDGGPGGAGGAAGTGGTGGAPGTTGDLGYRGPVGGLVGWITTSGSTRISDSHASGAVSGESFLGGLVGRVYMLSNVTIDNSHAAVTLDGVSDLGGLIGGVELSNTVVISDSYVAADLLTDDADHVGGLVGQTYEVDNDLTIIRSYTSGDIEGDADVGGLIGWASGFVSIVDSYSSGTVTGDEDVGGLVGYSYLYSPITISGSYTTGSVIGRRFVAGLIGYSESIVTVTNSYSTADISGDNYLGGLIGFAEDDVEIVSSFTRGQVITPPTGDTAAGFVGYADGGVSITDSYTTSDVDTPNYQGGFVGYPTSPISGNNSFCLDTADGCGEGVFDVTATSTQLRSRDFLESEHGWAFEATWCIRSWANDGYPILHDVDFGPGGTNNCNRFTWSTRRTVTFDPAGGACAGRTIPWSQTTRRAINVPTDCTRDGYVLLGWTRDPALTTPEQLLTTVVARSGILTAVWGALPPAPPTVNVLANFLCLQNCDAALVVWPTSSNSSDTTIVTIDEVPTACSITGETAGERWCLIIGLAPRTTHSVSVAWSNKYGTGSSTTATFILS